jgi:hypothetical protein
MRSRVVIAIKLELEVTHRNKTTSQTMLKMRDLQKFLRSVVVDLCVFAENFQRSQAVFILLLVKTVRDPRGCKAQYFMLVPKIF